MDLQTDAELKRSFHRLNFLILLLRCVCSELKSQSINTNCLLQPVINHHTSFPLCFLLNCWTTFITGFRRSHSSPCNMQTLNDPDSRLYVWRLGTNVCSCFSWQIVCTLILSTSPEEIKTCCGLSVLHKNHRVNGLACLHPTDLFALGLAMFLTHYGKLK